MAGGYLFYLNKCLLPVTPSKMEIKINNNNKTVKLINEGEVNILKRAELSDIDFECMIPQIRYPFAQYLGGFQGAKYYLDYFESLKNSQKPFQFIVTRTLPGGSSLFNTNIKVSMESYTVSEDAKDGFDLTVKVKLKQYREYGTKTVNIVLGNANANRSAESAPVPAGQGYTVKKGDCLWKIAKKFYGNGSKHTIIYNANKDTIEKEARAHKKASSSNGHWIYPGTVLTIPAG